MGRLDHPLVLNPVASAARPRGLSVQHGEAGARADLIRICMIPCEAFSSPTELTKSMFGKAAVGK